MWISDAFGGKIRTGGTRSRTARLSSMSSFAGNQLPTLRLIHLSLLREDGGNAGGHQSDPVAAQACHEPTPHKPNPHEPHPKATDWLRITGYTLILA